MGTLALLEAGCRGDPLTHGLDLIESRQYQAAVDFLNEELDKSPGDMKLLELYGIALLRNQQPSLAVWPLRRVFREQGVESSALVPLAEALARGGAPEEAVDVATQGLEANPSSWALLRIRSGAYAASLNHEGALADMEELIAHNPKNLRYQENRLNNLVKLERLDEAQEVINSVADLIEEDEGIPASEKARYCATRALFNHKRGESDLGGEGLAKCLAAYPAYPEVIFPYVEYLQESGQGREVLGLLEEQAGSEAGKGRLVIQALLAAELRGMGREAEATEVMVRTAEYLVEPPAWLELADHYVAIDDMPGAADAVAQALNEAEEGAAAYNYMNVDGLFAYADVLVQAERFEQARQMLPHLGELAHKLLIEARILLLEGEPRQALAKYEEAFKLWPSNPGARYLAGVAAMRIGEFDRAAGLFQDSFRSDSTISDAGIILARLQMLQGSPGSAFDTLALYAMKNPGNRTALRLMMHAAVMAGAVSVLPGIQGELALGGFPGQGLAEHALALEGLAGSEAALELLEAEEQLESPEFFLAFASWARIAAATGDRERVLKRVRAAAKANPESAPLQLVLGMTLSLDPESVEEAGGLFHRAIELDENFVEAWVLLARYLERKEDFAGAAEAYTQAASLEKEEPEHDYRAGVVLLAIGEEEAGEARLAKVLARHPWHGDSAAWLAQLALERGDTGPESVALARLASRFSEELTPRALETLGKLRLDRQEFPEANVAFRQLIKFTGDSPTAQYYLAQSLIGMGRNEDAIERLNQALAHGEAFPLADVARTQLVELTQEEAN